MSGGAEVERLLEVMRRLREPGSGCPWDLEQTFATIAPYTIEEAYEVADAIARGEMRDLKEELGDLLLQVVYHAQIAAEAGHFVFADVAAAIAEKMVRRHPHVFDQAEVAGVDAQRAAWEELKSAERGAKRSGSLLDDLPRALPALTRAEKLQKRATRGGFDWPGTEQVLDKMAEEIGELRAELDGSGRRERIEDELGDLLFTIANLARHLGLDPEEALRRANRKFERRFRAVEQAVAGRQRRLSEMSLDELELLWQQAKFQE